MAFGQRVTSVAEMKKRAAASSGQWLRTIPKDSDITVRFLRDPGDEDAWMRYREVYDPSLGKNGAYYPLPEGEDPPDGLRASNKYVVSVLDTESDRVIALKIPMSLATALIARHTKYGTLTDRDYELFRQGSTKEDTQYGLSPETPTKRRLTKYKLLDLEKVLQEEYDNAFGNDTSSGGSYDEDEEDDDRPRRSNKSTTKRRPKQRVETPAVRSVKKQKANEKRALPKKRTTATKNTTVARRRMTR